MERLLDLWGPGMSLEPYYGASLFGIAGSRHSLACVWSDLCRTFLPCALNAIWPLVLTFRHFISARGSCCSSFWEQSRQRDHLTG